MEIVIFVLGVIAGYFIEKILDKVPRAFQAYSKQRHWKRAEETWRKFQSLSAGLEVVQTGWKNRAFSEKGVTVTISNGIFELRQDVAQKTREPHQKEWNEQNVQNNEQCGVSKIRIHRISDEDTGKTPVTHDLRIYGGAIAYLMQSAKWSPWPTTMVLIKVRHDYHHGAQQAEDYGKKWDLILMIAQTQHSSYTPSCGTIESLTTSSLVMRSASYRELTFNAYGQRLRTDTKAENSIFFIAGIENNA